MNTHTLTGVHPFFIDMQLLMPNRKNHFIAIGACERLRSFNHDESAPCPY
jgi:hypothetical protein